jgi:hypothetical protein
MIRPPIKGIVRARRGAYIATPPARFLTRDAEEALFAGAEVLSEGSERKSKNGERAYCGSTMITFDLKHLRAQWRGSFDAVARDAVFDLAAGSVRIRSRATRIACAEVARRVTERPLGTAIVETKVLLRGETLLIDVDLEVPIGIFSGMRRAT